jgi:predicted ATPase
MPIDRINIKNFKSIRDSGNITIRPINVLIGPNGVGKTNFIQFFKLLNSIYKQRLKYFTADNGYENRILYFGRKRSKFLEGSIVFKPERGGNTNNRYNFKLIPQIQGVGFYFEKDLGGYNYFARGYNENWDYLELGGEGKAESELRNNTSSRAEFLSEYFEGFKVFHFHDTSSGSPLKQANQTFDYEYLKEDGSNLAAFLYKVKDTSPQHFKIIEHTVRSVAPFFERFDLKPDSKNPDMIFLNWLEKGSDDYFNAHNLSDGTLRFIALATLLLQPNVPKTIIIDEPELGLHPFAIQKLGALIKSASVKSQIIISTQSVNLVDQFTADDIIVVERKDDQTVFSRQKAEELETWLADYTLSELWEKNVLGGRPR